jgi:drug/metabolite transporter (DMT)-like permease
MSTLILFGSEIALSLYPQLIKQLPTQIDIQIAIRLITYSFVALLGIFYNNDIHKIFQMIISSAGFFKVLWLGCINIFHILSSYISFACLPSGISYTLFYMYPIFNILARNIFWNEKTVISNFIYLIIALAGVYLVTSSTYTHDNSADSKTLDIIFSSYFSSKVKNNKNIIGSFSGIFSAISETIIYLSVKNDIISISPFTQIIRTYLLGGILSAGYLIYNYYLKNRNVLSEHDTTLSNPINYEYWIMIILFNLLVGFVGYLLRFYTIPRLGTLKFNTLIFIGVVFSYIWGYIFGKEKINLQAISGSLCIIGSIFMLSLKKY